MKVDIFRFVCLTYFFQRDRGGEPSFLVLHDFIHLSYNGGWLLLDTSGTIGDGFSYYILVFTWYVRREGDFKCVTSFSRKGLGLMGFFSVAAVLVQRTEPLDLWKIAINQGGTT